jgi:HEAT repeat protein
MDDQKKWQADLQSPDVTVRAAAAERLCLAGTESVNAAVELVTACGDEESVRNWAVAALEELGPPDPAAIEPLVGLLSSPNSLTAYWATTLLGRLGPSAAVSQDALVQVLSNSNDASVQERSAWALGKIGANSSSATTALEQASASSNPRLARLAESALSQTEKL